MKLRTNLLVILLVGIFAVEPASATTNVGNSPQDCYVVLPDGGSSTPIGVRARPSTDAAVVVRVGHRASVHVIDETSGGWKKIIYRRGKRRFIGWIPEEYLWC